MRGTPQAQAQDGDQDLSAPVVSIVIPYYNRRNTIDRAMRSIADQNFRAFEVVIVDDGSTEPLQAADVECRGCDVRILRQDNAGANAARNRGIMAARGKYVAMLDSDDEFLPHHLENAVAALDAAPANIAVFSPVIVDRGNDKRFIKPPRAPREGEHIADYLLRDRGFIQTSTLVLPRELALATQYSAGLPYGQDKDFAIRLYDHGVRFRMLTEPAAIWADGFDPDRVSSKAVAGRRSEWLDSVRPIITDRAYHGDRGWSIARSYRREGQGAKALWLYLNALARGCYSPRLALMIFTQIFVPERSYRRLIDFIGPLLNRA